jgi:hypothetical protein
VIYRLTEGEISEVCAKILKAYFKDENEEKEKKK